jgi:hypothetical protein
MIEQSNSQSINTVNIRARDVSGQIVVGDNNQQTQTSIGGSTTEVTQADLVELQQIFEALRNQVKAAISPEQQSRALERVDELEAAVTEEKPDLTTIEYVKQWFAKNFPTLTGAVVGVVVHPIVGKVVEAAGEIAADDFRKRFGG